MTGNTFTNSQPPSRVRANACASLSNGVLSKAVHGIPAA